MDKRLLELAIEALERKKAGIEEEIAAIRAEIGSTGFAVRNLPSTGTGRGRKRTAAERKAQAQRMREIWKARRAKAGKPAAASEAKVRSMTAAQKNALSLAMKKAWKKRKAAAKKTP